MFRRVIKLNGIVDSYDGKKIILGGHNDSIDKIQRLHPDRGKNPILDGNKFYVFYNTNIPELKGEKVAVWVYTKKYDFISTFEHNKGERVQGWNLYLTKIENDSDWS